MNSLYHDRIGGIIHKGVLPLLVLSSFFYLNANANSPHLKNAPSESEKSAEVIQSVVATASTPTVFSGGSVTLSAQVTPATYSETLLSENFNAASNSWIKINNSEDNAVANAAWTLREDGYDPDCYENSPAFHSNDNSQFYMSSSCAQGVGGVTETILQSPEMNTTGYTSLTLDFYQFYRDWGGAGSIEVSTDGNNWTQVAAYTSDQGDFDDFANATINLDAYVDNASFYVRFKYNDSWGWYWALDNVTVSGTKAITYEYSWSASPAATAGLPAGAGTSSTSNLSIVANPTETTNYTVTATDPSDASSLSSSPVTVTVEVLSSPYILSDPGTYQFEVPTGVNSIDVQAWGGGGGGSSRRGKRGGGGGGGGGYRGGTLTVSPGDIIEITVGQGGAGGYGNRVNGEFGTNTIVEYSTGTFPGTIVAYGGEGGYGNNSNGGSGGEGVFSGNVGNQTAYTGGDGGKGDNNEGGAGGGGAGDSEDGEDGDDGNDNSHNGGDGGNALGGDGGFGGDDGAGGDGAPYGGGGGAAGDDGNNEIGGGEGGNGAVILTFCAPPSISTQPVNTAVTYDNNAIFTVATDASDVSSYQWQVNSGSGWADTGTNSSTLTITQPNVAMSGYLYRCIITIDCGSFNTSESATLTVNPKELNVIADDQTVAYGTPDGDITLYGSYSVTGFINGDNSSVISGLNTISYTTNYTETSNAGSTGITITPDVSGLSADNYSFLPVSGSITISKADQFISLGSFDFTLPLNSFTIVPIVVTSSSGLPVTVTLEPGSAATLNYDIGEDPPYFLTNIGTTGFVTLHASQDGNANYNAAATESQTFDVTKSNQIISFPEIDDFSYADNLTVELQAVASSGLDVSYVVVSGPATLSGNTLTINGAGDIWISASQAGDASYNAAIDVNRSFTVNKGTQTITINVPSGAITETTQITATSTSNLTVSLSLGAGSAATDLIDQGGYYTLTGIGGSGSIYIVGNQSGNTNYLAADQVIQTIDISKSNQTITFNTISNQTFAPSLSVPLTASASSGLSVAYMVISGPAALNGSSLDISGVGSVIVEASQAGDASYNPAPTVTQQFEISKATPVITQADISKALNDPDFTLAPSSTSGGAFTFISGDDEVFTVSGSTASVIGAGSTTLDISQEPTANYNGATKTVSFTVGKAASTITVSGENSFTYSGNAQGPADVTVVGSTGEVTLNYQGTGSTTYGPSITKPVNAGTYSAIATVVEDDDYEGATSTPYAFTISKADATIIVTSYTETYSGEAFTAIGTATGVASEQLSGLDLSATTHTEAATYNNDPWIFTDVTGNYNDAAGNVNNLINPKDLSVTALDQAKCFGQTFLFDGTEFTSIGLVDGETIGTVTLSSVGADAATLEGNYDIDPSLATGGTFNASNYLISYESGNMVVNSQPTLGTATQETIICPGSFAVINLEGLVPDNIFTLDYTINGVAQDPVTGLSSDVLGNSSFATAYLTEENNGQILQITGITIISETPNCTQNFTKNVVLSVDQAPTLETVSQVEAVCAGTPATINLEGLLPGITFTLEYTINDIDQTPIENLVADGSGISSFTTPNLSAANDGQLLEVTGIIITSKTPGCIETFEKSISLDVNPVSSGGTVSSNQTICNGDVPGDLVLSGSSGNIQWQSSTDNVNFSDITGATSAILSGAQMGALGTTHYYKALLSTGGCGSSESNTVTITVQEVSISLVSTSSQVCLGDVLTSFSYSLPGGSPDLYSIDFDLSAESAGFNDITDATLSGGLIELNVPGTATPAIYNATLRVKNSGTGCTSSVHNLSIEINAPPATGNIIHD